MKLFSRSGPSLEFCETAVLAVPPPLPPSDRVTRLAAPEISPSVVLLRARGPDLAVPYFVAAQPPLPETEGAL